jgi:hypothetical protein
VAVLQATEKFTALPISSFLRTGVQQQMWGCSSESTGLRSRARLAFVAHGALGGARLFFDRLTLCGTTAWPDLQSGRRTIGLGVITLDEDIKKRKSVQGLLSWKPAVVILAYVVSSDAKPSRSNIVVHEEPGLGSCTKRDGDRGEHEYAGEQTTIYDELTIQTGLHITQLFL